MIPFFRGPSKDYQQGLEKALFLKKNELNNKV